MLRILASLMFRVFPRSSHETHCLEANSTPAATLTRRQRRAMNTINMGGIYGEADELIPSGPNAGQRRPLNNFTMPRHYRGRTDGEVRPAVYDPVPVAIVGLGLTSGEVVPVLTFQKVKTARRCLAHMSWNQIEFFRKRAEELFGRPMELKSVNVLFVCNRPHREIGGWEVLLDADKLSRKREAAYRAFRQSVAEGMANIKGTPIEPEGFLLFFENTSEDYWQNKFDAAIDPGMALVELIRSFNAITEKRENASGESDFPASCMSDDCQVCEQLNVTEDQTESLELASLI